MMAVSKARICARNAARIHWCGRKAAAPASPAATASARTVLTIQIQAPILCDGRCLFDCDEDHEIARSGPASQRRIARHLLERPQQMAILIVSVGLMHGGVTLRLIGCAAKDVIIGDGAVNLKAGFLKA